MPKAFRAIIVSNSCHNFLYCLNFSFLEISRPAPIFTTNKEIDDAELAVDFEDLAF